MSTTLLDRPPTDPIDRPCPPEQTEFSKVIPWPCHQFPLQRRSAPDNVVTHSARIDSNTIILVVTSRTGNDHIRRTANVEAIGVLPLAVTSSVVNGHASNSQAIRTVDADGLDGRVLDVKVCDGRAGEVMGGEELWLRHAAGAPLAIPVLRPSSVEDRPGRTLNGDGLAPNLQEWPCPLGVAPGSGTLEDDLSWFI